MVEETKLLVRAFHALEDTLPPLVPVRALKAKAKPDWTAVARATFQMAREVERILLAKLELWKKLGADDNESRGLVFSFTHSGVVVRTWIGITGLLGLVDAGESGTDTTLGVANSAGEALLIETPEGAVAIFYDEIETTCTRLEAVQNGVATAFKEWWTVHQTVRGSAAA
jgi:hypothetical protein